MRGDEPGPVLHVDAIFGFADLELTPDQQIGHRIPMPVHIDKALDVNEAMVQGVDLRHEEQKARAWPLRSGRSANVRPAKKLCSMK